MTVSIGQRRIGKTLGKHCVVEKVEGSGHWVDMGRRSVSALCWRDCVKPRKISVRKIGVDWWDLNPRNWKKIRDWWSLFHDIYWRLFYCVYLHIKMWRNVMWCHIYHPLILYSSLGSPLYPQTTTSDNLIYRIAAIWFYVVLLCARCLSLSSASVRTLKKTYPIFKCFTR